MPGDLTQLLEHVTETVVSPWSSDGVRSLAVQSPGSLSRNDWLVIGDARLLQLRWFAQSVIPSTVSAKAVTAAAQIQKSSLDRVTTVFPHLGKGERQALAGQVATLARRLMERENRRRTSIPIATRRHLLVLVGEPPKCYLCGARFNDREVSFFLGESLTEPIADAVVDFIYPRGAKGSDRRIAVEHVRPIADGGSSDPENLQLACQYCNSLKSDALTLYARGQYGRPFQHPTLGLIYPPNPLWVVRIMALDGKCYECGITTMDAPLRVAPGSGNGVPRYINPLALRVVCEEHDPIREHRYVLRSILASRSRDAR